MREDQWWHETWNPVTGCSPVSPGCDHCWAERFAHRFYSQEYGPAYFEPRFHSERVSRPDAWRAPRRVFTCGMGDLFHRAVTAIRVALILDRMKRNPQHQFFVLTKRPDRARQMLCENTMLRQFLDLPNLWLGVSVENQEWADKRIPVLLEIPVQHHFLCIEPMLDRVDLKGKTTSEVSYLHPTIKHDTGGVVRPGLRWVILGAETGPGARPMDLEWARSVRDQCKAAGVPLWIKKISPGPPWSIVSPDFLPTDLRIKERP